MFDKRMLWRIRNQINIVKLAQALGMQIRCKYRQLMFVCPLCEFNKATFFNKANIGRCWRCQNRFNPIDLVMAVKGTAFRTSVIYLIRQWSDEITTMDYKTL